MARGNAEHSQQAAGLASDSHMRFGDANRLLDQMVVAMEETNAQSGKVSQSIKTVAEIAFQTNILNLGSQEQARGIGQIAKGIALMEQVTQRNAASAEESASAAEELTAQSETLKSVVERLVLMIKGDRV